MPGKTQRQYVSELMKFNKSLKVPLYKVKSVLPLNYTKYDILNLFKELFPYEWNIIKERYKIYKEKDDFLKKVGKKIRYKPTLPEYYLFELQKVKHILSQRQKKLHAINFNETNRLEKLGKLGEETRIRMTKINEKIDLAKEYIQDVEPSYIDIFIHAYHKDGISQDGKWK